jgi:FKBP-type peptidyl-prolyl cis-trans isomerase (trigger factor)
MLTRLGQYKGLEVERVDPRPVTPDRIAMEVEILRERHATTSPAARPAEHGDLVTLDFSGPLEASDVTVMLGGGGTAEGFEDGLLGVRAGETRDVTITQNGSPVTLSVHVQGVTMKHRPNVDELADQGGHETPEELFAECERWAQEAEIERAKHAFADAALDAVVAGSDLRVTRREIERATGQPVDEIPEQARARIERVLSREMVLARIIFAEKLTPTDRELPHSDLLHKWARSSGRSAYAIVADHRREGQLDSLREQVARDRAIRLITGSAIPVAPAATAKT